MKLKHKHTVSLYGPDGIGKTTVIEILIDYYSSKNNEVYIRNWRPGYLKSLGSLLGKDPEVTLLNKGKIIPRRTSGKFQLLRLIYYGIDFLLGYICDITFKSPNEIIIYDRGFYDTFIDNKRYGLEKGIWLNLFEKIIPTYGLHILFIDEPERIYKRKQELTVTEICEQLNAWMKFVANKRNIYIIRINKHADKIAEQVKDIIKENFDRLQKENKSTKELQYEWLSHIFNKENEDNFDPYYDSKYRLLNLRDGRGYVINCVSGKIIEQGLSFYKPSNLKSKFVLTVLKMLNTPNIAKYLLSANSLVNFNLFEKELKKVLKPSISIVGISCGAHGPLRKPVIKIIKEDGDYYYVKVSTNTTVKSALIKEAAVLDFLNECGINRLAVPQKIYCGYTGNYFILVMSSLNNYKNSTTIDLKDTLTIISSFSNINYCIISLDKSVFYSDLLKNINNIKNTHYKALCDEMLINILKKNKNTIIPFHFAHGDLTRWNGFKSNNTAYLYDFEYAMKNAPLGYDLIRFILQEKLHIKRESFESLSDYFMSNKEILTSFKLCYKGLEYNSLTLDELFYICYGLYITYQLSIYSTSEEYYSYNINLYRYLCIMYLNKN